MSTTTTAAATEKPFDLVNWMAKQFAQTLVQIERHQNLPHLETAILSETFQEEYSNSVRTIRKDIEEAQFMGKAMVSQVLQTGVTFECCRMAKIAYKKAGIDIQ